MQTISVDKLSEEVMKKDGLVDILIGFLFFCYGIYVFSFNNLSPFVATLKASSLFMTFLYSFAYIILVLLGLLFYLSCKSDSISNSEILTRNDTITVLLLIIVLFLFCLTMMGRTFDFTKSGFHLPTVIFGLCISSIFILIGYVNHLKRLYLYGLLVGLSFPIINVLGKTFTLQGLAIWIIFIPSIFILLFGIYKLKQYLSVQPLDLSIFKSDQKPTILKVKRELEASFYQDGKSDIEHGIFLLFFGFLRYFGQEDWSVIYFLLFVVLIIILSSRIDLLSSRVGKVRLKLPVVEERNPEKENLMFVLVLAFLLFYFFIVGFFDLPSVKFPLNSLVKYFDNLSILVFFFSISLIGYAKNYKISRLYLYFLFYNFSLPFYFFLLVHFSKPISILISYGLPSLIIILIGISVMIRFLKKYPVVEQNEI